MWGKNGVAPYDGRKTDGAPRIVSGVSISDGKNGAYVDSISCMGQSRRDRNDDLAAG